MTNNGTVVAPTNTAVKMKVHLVVTRKVERLPTEEQTVQLEEYELTGITIKGKQLGKFYFNAKIDTKKYQKVYIDTRGKQIYGKVDELTPWAVIFKIDSMDERNI